MENLGIAYLFPLHSFVDQGQNGYKIAITDEMDQKEKVQYLAKAIIQLFTKDDVNAFIEHSYQKAEEYLTEEVVKRWIQLLK